tara:strand:+ start:501 stop:1001 length:501 start_codon:yes stop_codon:yes gene_type:complete
MSESYYVDEVNALLDKMLENIDDTDKKIENLQNSQAQVGRVCNSISSFVNSTLGGLSSGEDAVSISQQLVNALAQVGQYASSEPNNLSLTLSSLSHKKDAYSECLELLKDTASSFEDRSEDSDEEEAQEPSAPKDIRSVGDRPEKLKDIRNENMKLDGGETEEENI